MKYVFIKPDNIDIQRVKKYFTLKNTMAIVKDFNTNHLYALCYCYDKNNLKTFLVTKQEKEFDIINMHLSEIDNNSNSEIFSILSCMYDLYEVENSIDVETDKYMNCDCIELQDSELCQSCSEQLEIINELNDTKEVCTSNLVHACKNYN